MHKMIVGVFRSTLKLMEKCIPFLSEKSQSVDAFGEGANAEGKHTNCATSAVVTNCFLTPKLTC